MGALVAHIEYGKCIRLDTGVIEEIREKKLEFPRKLAALTQKPVKNNYENFMPSAGSVDPELGWTTTEDAALFKLSDGDFPALSSETKGTILKTSTLVQKEEGITSGGLTARAIFDAMDPHDPEHPLFNVGRYCCEFTGKFNCPKDRCWYVLLFMLFLFLQLSVIINTLTAKPSNQAMGLLVTSNLIQARRIVAQAV